MTNARARPVSLADLPAMMTLREAAKAVFLSERTLRRAIRRGELDPFMSRGRTDPLRLGAGHGYQFTAHELWRWYNGLPREVAS